MYCACVYKHKACIYETENIDMNTYELVGSLMFDSEVARLPLSFLPLIQIFALGTPSKPSLLQSSDPHLLDHKTTSKLQAAHVVIFALPGPQPFPLYQDGVLASHTRPRACLILLILGWLIRENG
jgi:hypothetical protein